jgi:hypothetical protein
MKNFLAKLLGFFAACFQNVDEFVKEHIVPSIDTVQRIKNIVDGTIGDVITAVIPGDADEIVREWISKNLSIALKVMQLSGAINNSMDIDTQIDYLVKTLRPLNKKMRQALYLKIASEMAKSSSNGVAVKGHAIDTLVQLQYSKIAEGIDDKPLVIPPVKAPAKRVVKK